MRFIRTLATAALCTVMIAGPNVTVKGGDQAAAPDDGEPFSTQTIILSDPPEVWAGVFDPKPKIIEIKLGKSLEQEQAEKAAAEAEAKKQEELKARASKNVIAREISPGKSYDPSAKIIMADIDYRDEYGRSNCVKFATRYSGIYKRLGYGVTIASEGNNPQVGAIALDRYRGHAAVVVAINDRTLTLWDSNWIKGYVTERKVDISSQRGYIYK